MIISKSNYISYKQCHRQFYLDKHKPNLNHINGSILRRLEMGKEIGHLAKSLFKNLVEVEYNTDKDIMIGDTQEFMGKEKVSIAEASFLHKDLFCSVDILVKDNDKYDIYEVKSSTSIKKDFLKDIAFQYYVLKQYGITIRNTYTIYVNKEYIKDGDIEDALILVGNAYVNRNLVVWDQDLQTEDSIVNPGTVNATSAEQALAETAGIYFEDSEAISDYDL